MIREEVEEYDDAKSEHEQVDAIADVIVIAVNELGVMGYSLPDVMNEVLKEINSRRQDPEQQQMWEMLGISGKWLKDKSPEAQALWYNADFSECRR